MLEKAKVSFPLQIEFPVAVTSVALDVILETCRISGPQKHGFENEVLPVAAQYPR